MKVLYKNNGEIVNAVYDYDWIKVEAEDLKIYDFIDESIIDNRPLAKTILDSLGKIDSEGLGKCYIKDGELYERKNWREQKIKENILYE